MRIDDLHPKAKGRFLRVAISDPTKFLLLHSHLEIAEEYFKIGDTEVLKEGIKSLESYLKGIGCDSDFATVISKITKMRIKKGEGLISPGAMDFAIYNAYTVGMPVKSKLKDRCEFSDKYYRDLPNMSPLDIQTLDLGDYLKEIERGEKDDS